MDELPKNGNLLHHIIQNEILEIAASLLVKEIKGKFA
jgi:hypothetical protein